MEFVGGIKIEVGKYSESCGGEVKFFSTYSYILAYIEKEYM